MTLSSNLQNTIYVRLLNAFVVSFLVKLSLSMYWSKVHFHLSSIGCKKGEVIDFDGIPDLTLNSDALKITQCIGIRYTNPVYMVPKFRETAWYG